MIRDCPHNIQSYWYFRDEITCEEGILYKGVRLVMPQSEWASTLKVLHLGHYAINKMNLRARETVYWPGISEDIKVTYHRCDICSKFARTQQKETLQYVETPQARLEQLGQDLFSLKNTHYLVAVDYFSQISHCQKTAESPLTECNQTSQRNLHRNRCALVYSLRRWHTIHITRVQRLYKKVGYTAQNYIAHQCTV